MSDLNALIEWLTSEALHLERNPTSYTDGNGNRFTDLKADRFYEAAKAIARLHRYESALEGMKAKSDAATAGPWDDDVTDAEDGYGHYKAYALRTPEGRSICDTINSELMVIDEEYDFDGGIRWDATGRADMRFAASAANAIRAMLEDDLPQPPFPPTP